MLPRTDWSPKSIRIYYAILIFGLALLLCGFWTIARLGTYDRSQAYFFREISDAGRTWSAKFYWYDKGGYYGAFADFFDHQGRFLGRRDVTHGGSWEDVAEAISRCEPVVMTPDCIRIDEVLEPVTQVSGGEVVIYRYELEATTDSNAVMTIGFVYSISKNPSQAEESVVIRGHPSRTIQPGELLAIQTDEEVFPVSVLTIKTVNQFDGSVEVLVKGVLRHQIRIGDRLIEPPMQSE